ncbi:MAG: permease-like cell division protein FtsX [Bacteroidales bacterium]|jgi:cell division transport system permease protein|nr:permease-like cell division protein FtsX [Bacteroidales bacterium]
MVQVEEKHNRRQLTSSYLTSVVSIMLVLFMLGLLGLLVLHAQKLSNHIRENIGFEIIMKPEVKEAEIIRIQKMLDAVPYVKSTVYITKEEATKRLSKDLGEDFIQWLGDEENPLLPSVDVRFIAAWANNDSLAIIEQDLMQQQAVKEVFYQKSLVHLINQNVRRISIVLLLLSALLLLIAIALINNTIRLSIYSKRFLVRSMQLVGATESFIRKPFVLSGIMQGVLGGFLALFMLSLVLYTANKNLPELNQLQDMETVIALFIGVLALGILLTGLFTHLSINKYLRSKTDKLFA